MKSKPPPREGLSFLPHRTWGLSSPTRSLIKILKKGKNFKYFKADRKVHPSYTHSQPPSDIKSSQFFFTFTKKNFFCPNTKVLHPPNPPRVLLRINKKKNKENNFSGIFFFGYGIDDDCDGYCAHSECYYGAFHGGDEYGWRRMQDFHVVELEYGWSLYVFLFFLFFLVSFSSFIPPPPPRFSLYKRKKRTEEKNLKMR